LVGDGFYLREGLPRRKIGCHNGEWSCREEVSMKMRNRASRPKEFYRVAWGSQEHSWIWTHLNRDISFRSTLKTVELYN
jgi:hypothetical protein